MAKRCVRFMGLSKGIGFVAFLILTLALAFPAYGDTDTPNLSYTESGAPGVQPDAGAVEFRHRVVESQQPDGTQPAPPRPSIKVGEPSYGGDVLDKVDMVSEQPVTPSPLWQQLDQMSQAAKENAVIELEGDSGLSASDSQYMENIGSLWNTGRFDEAIASLRALEEGGLKLAIGISWKRPIEKGDHEWMANDVLINTRTSIQETHLDFDAQNGNLFAVLKYPTGSWSVNISTDDGQTWQETYTWGSIADDVSAAVVDNYLWVGYVGNADTYHEGRTRRFFVSSGSVDTAYGYQVLFDKGIAINEVAVTTNADNYDNRVYYYAILSNNSLIYYWAYDVHTTSPVWAEMATGVTNAGQGLDATWNQDGTSGYYLYASYTASDGTNPVMVLRHASGVWEAINVEPNPSLGTPTSISAYDDTIITVFEYRDASNYPGIKYWISYDGGGVWLYGYIAQAQAGAYFYNPAVAARKGGGIAVIYQEEVGEPDPCWYTYRSYDGSIWWTTQEQFNETDVITGTLMEIESLPPLPGNSYAFGPIWISTSYTAYFDRSDDAGTAEPIIRIQPSSLTINQSDSVADARDGAFVPILKGAKSAPQAEPRLNMLQSDGNRLDVRLTTPSMFVEQRRENSDVYKVIRLGRYNGELPPGQPNLPAIRKYVYVSKGKSANFEVVVGDSVEFTNYLVYPTQLPQPDTVGAKALPFYRDEGVYSTDEWVPKEMVTLGPVQIIRGHAVQLLSICPFQYNPAKKILRVFPEINAHIRFNGQEIDIDSNLRSPVFDSFIKGFVVNPGAFAEGEPVRAEAYTGEDYLIITAPAFLTQANALAAHKTGLGISTGVVTTTDTGPSKAQIQAYIQSAYNTHSPAPTYVLLLGDVETIPTTYDGTADTGTDLYYSTVDGADYLPDIFLGRIPVDTVSEAQTVVNKIINYETSPPAFSPNAAVAAYFQDDNNDGYEDRRFVRTSEEVRDFLLGESYNVQRIYCTNSTTPTNYNNGLYGSGEPLPAGLLKPGFAWSGWSGDIDTAINGGVFLLMHRDHGMDRNDYYTHTGWGDPYYVETHIAALTNGDLLPVVMSMNCQTGWFDGETDHHPTLNYESFCELFLRKSNGGAVGVFGASRTSYSGHNDFMAEGMIDCVWPNFLPTVANNSGASARMGPMLNHGKLAMDQLWGDPWGVRQLEYELFHVFGDPSLEMYTPSIAGNTFTIYNDGTADLEITSMTTTASSWLSWTPTAPLTITPGGSRVITVNINWAQVSGSGETAQILVYSNDPDMSPYPGAVHVTAVKGGAGDELAVDFGGNGLWHYDGSTFTQLNGQNPEAMEDWNGGLAGDFDGNGLWNYNGSSWNLLTTLNPQSMEAWDSSLAVDFGTFGLWSYNGSSWSLLTTSNAETMQAWSGGLAADFGSSGLWTYNGSSWSLLTTSNASGMESWANGLAVDFGSFGLWNYNGSSWSLLTTSNPEDMRAWSGGLATDFGTFGLWNYNGSSWSLLTTSNASGMADWNGGVAVDFSSGLWSYDGSSWDLLTTTHPEDMEGWATSLAADLGTSGLWNYNGSVWSQLTAWNAEDMIDVDLY
jgi:hypothetical protein